MRKDPLLRRIAAYRTPCQNDPNTLKLIFMPLKKPVPMSPALPVPPTHEIILLDTEDNPSGTRSVFSMVGPAVQEAMDQHMFEYPELFHQNEQTLMDAIRGKMGTKPHGIGATENRLRVSFWMEFDRACELYEPMQMKRVYGGVCTKEYFHQTFLRKPEKVAWMLCPLSSYTISMEEALVYGITKLREVLDFPLYLKNGEPNTKVGELILKTVQQLDLRVKGAIIQKIETKSMNVHAHVGKPPGEAMEDLDARLEELEERATQSGLSVVEVKADLE